MACERMSGGSGLPTSFDLATRRRLFWCAALAALAATIYVARIRHEMIDFLTWRQAVVRALDGEPLYRVSDGHYQFKYFPAFALVMAPFGILGPEAGKLLWFSVEVVLLACLIRWSVAALPGRRRSRAVLVSVTVVLMAKFYAHELLLGQTNLLLGALLVGALLCVRDRPLAAGALVGAAVFVKPYALILTPWLLVHRGGRAAAAAAAVIIAGLLLPVVVYGWGGNLELLDGWRRTVVDSTSPNLLGNDNVSIAAMWAKWLGIGPPAAGLAWLTIAAAAGLAIAVSHRRTAVADADYLEWALLLLLIPLVSPQGWDYVLLLGTPAVMCLVDRWRELGTGWRWGLGAALALMGLTMFDLMGRQLYGQFMALSVVSVCALAIAVGLLHLRWRGLA
jgi:hypothetical protein